MRHPSVGETIYAYADKQNRVGETEFLCSTQEHATKNLRQLRKEALESLCCPEEEIRNPLTNKWEPVFDKEREKDLIIYQMIRIQ